MVDLVDPARLSGMVDWLEDENRQLKAQLGHQQDLLEQALALLRDQTLRLRALEEEVAVSRLQIAKIPELEVSQQHERETVAQTQADQAALRQLFERMERDRLADNERHRVAMVELWQRLDYLRQEFEPVPARLQGLSDSNKRLHDAVFVTGKQIEALSQQLDVLQGRVQLALDLAKKIEQDIVHDQAEMEPLRRADEMLLTRIQIAGDAVKALSEQVSLVLATQEQWRELSDRLEVTRAEQQRSDRELAELRQLGEAHGERLVELNKLAMQAESRRETLSQRLDGLHEDLLRVHLEAERQYSDLRALLERQARRQLAEFETQAKELRDRSDSRRSSA